MCCGLGSLHGVDAVHFCFFFLFSLRSLSKFSLFVLSFSERTRAWDLLSTFHFLIPRLAREIQKCCWLPLCVEGNGEEGEGRHWTFNSWETTCTLNEKLICGLIKLWCVKGDYSSLDTEVVSVSGFNKQLSLHIKPLAVWTPVSCSERRYTLAITVSAWCLTWRQYLPASNGYRQGNVEGGVYRKDRSLGRICGYFVICCDVIISTLKPSLLDGLGWLALQFR